MFVQSGGLLPEILLGHAGIGLINLCLIDRHFLRLSGLNLQRFVNQIAQHLHPHALHFFCRNLPFVGRQQQS